MDQTVSPDLNGLDEKARRCVVARRAADVGGSGLDFVFLATRGKGMAMPLGHAALGFVLG